MFGKRLKQLRSHKKMTQQDLSKLLKVSPSTIGMYEQGRRDPDTNTLIFLAKHFNVSVDYLLGISNEKKVYTSDETMNFIKDFMKKMKDAGTDLENEPISKVMDELLEIAKIRNTIKNS